MTIIGFLNIWKFITFVPHGVSFRVNGSNFCPCSRIQMCCACVLLCERKKEKLLLSVDGERDRMTYIEAGQVHFISINGHQFNKLLKQINKQ